MTHYRLTPTIAAITAFIITAAASVALATQAAVAAADLPVHPDKLEFKPFDFQPPRAADYRHVLPSGVVVYLAPSHEFPLIDLSLNFKGGSYLDPADQVGLASATGAMIRRGGTSTMAPAQLDEEFDFLAANASTGTGGVESVASLNSLASNFDEAFALFVQMVRSPGFDAARLKIFKDEVIESMKQRNDEAPSIASREWARLMYGEDHYLGRVSTKASIDSITVDDLRAVHGRIFNPAPGNMIVAVSGDFEPNEMLAKLESAFAAWPASGPPNPNPPAPTHQLKPGVYHVEKDIPQGRVAIGQRGLMRDEPDWLAAAMMNDILGGGGFTSRITSRVRSDEGLAYSAGSQLSPGVWFPGEFRAGFESKSATVPLAAKIILEETDSIRTQTVAEEELDTSKKSFLERFPRTFESKPAMLGVFVNDELTNRPKDYWQTVRDNVRAVTREDVQRVASERLDPSKMAILIVGKWDAIAPGDLQGRASMKDFFNGEVTHLPLRDPLTQQPLESSAAPAATAP